MPSADCYTDHRLVHCTFTFKSPPKRKRPQTKKLQMYKLCEPRVKKNLQSCWRKDFIVSQLQSLRNSGIRRRPYFRKPQLKLLACRPGNTKTGLLEQIRKPKSCLKRNAPATIVCMQNLMTKLPKLHTRLPAVHSTLQAKLRTIAE